MVLIASLIRSQLGPMSCTRTTRAWRSRTKKSQVLDQNFSNQRTDSRKTPREKQPGLQKVTKDFQNLAAQQTSAQEIKCSNSKKDISKKTVMSWEHMAHGQLQLHQGVPSLIYFFFPVPSHQSIWWIYLCLTSYSSGKGLGMGWTQSFAPCCQKYYLAIASLSLASLQHVAHINLKEDISKCQGWRGTWNNMYTCKSLLK